MAYADGVDVAGVAYADDLVCRGAKCAQDIEPLATRRASHEDATEAPKPPEKRPHYEVSGVDEVDCAFVASSLFESRLQMFFLKSSGEHRPEFIPEFQVLVHCSPGKIIRVLCQVFFGFGKVFLRMSLL